MNLVFGFVGAQIGGTLFGSAALGWAVGSFIGSALMGGPDTQGPRMADLRISSSAYDKDINRIYGKMRTGGNIIYAQDITEIADTYRVGGILGFGGAEATNYTYTATFAIALCEGEAAGITKIWADSILVYDSTTVEGLAASLLPLNYEFHYGGENQEQSDILITYYGSDIPAHRGLCYMVFEDWELSQFGNRIPNITAEVIVVGTSAWPEIFDTTGYGNTVPTFTVLSGGETVPNGVQYKDGTIAVAYARVDSGDPDTGWAIQYYDLHENLLSEQIINSSPSTIPTVWGYGGTANVPGVVHYSTTNGSGEFYHGVAYKTTHKGYLDLPHLLTVQPDGYQHRTGGGAAVWADGHLLFTGGNITPNTSWITAYACTREGSVSLSMAWSHDIPYVANGYYLGFDVTEKYLYVAAAEGQTFSNTFAGYTNASMIKLDPITGAVLDAWYVTKTAASVPGYTANYPYFIVYNDIHFLRPGANNLAEILTYNSDDHTAEPTELIVDAASPINFLHAINVGTGGVIQTRSGTFSLASTVSEGAIKLPAVISDLCDDSGVESSDIETTSLVSVVVNGYAITQQQSARQSLEQLQTGYIFDVVESDWKVKFKARA